jgi:putative RecB family exonuclease
MSLLDATSSAAIARRARSRIVGGFAYAANVDQVVVVPEARQASTVPEARQASTVPEAREASTVPRGPSLSPSRAADFLTCPLLYRFRVVDRLPEAPSPAAARGTLVHAVLERLFDLPAAGRTPQAATLLIEPEWQRLVAAEPELTGVFGDDTERAGWFAQATEMLERYFTLEDPARIEPADRERPVDVELASGLRLRGYIDRLDVSASGDLRIVDYKTGTAPRADFEAPALFQMRFYALVLWRSEGIVPRQLQLIYLGNGEIVRFAPDEAALLATERKIEALWRAIERATLRGDWRPRPGKLCGWCAHQALCPAFGGTPPPLPEPAPPAEAVTDGVAGAHDGPTSGTPEAARVDMADPAS